MLNMNELTALVNTYRDNAQLLDALKEEQDQIRETLKAELAARELDKLEVGTHTVTVSRFNKTTLDSKAVKTIAPEVYNACAKVSTVTRLTVV